MEVALLNILMHEQNIVVEFLRNEHSLKVNTDVRKHAATDEETTAKLDDARTKLEEDRARLEKELSRTRRAIRKYLEKLLEPAKGETYAEDTVELHANR